MPNDLNDPDNPTLPLVRVWYDLIGLASRLRTTLGDVPEQALTAGEAQAAMDALAHLDDAHQALGERLQNPSWRYYLVLTYDEFKTLLWMGARGYEGGLVERADMVYGSVNVGYENLLHPGLVTLCYYAHNVSDLRQRVAADPDAWCAGAPRALLSKLQALYAEITRGEDN